MSRTYTKTMQFYFGVTEGDENTLNATFKFTKTPYVAATHEQPAEGGTVEITGLTTSAGDLPSWMAEKLLADESLMESLYISAQEDDAYAKELAAEDRADAYREGMRA